MVFYDPSNLGFKVFKAEAIIIRIEGFLIPAMTKFDTILIVGIILVMVTRVTVLPVVVKVVVALKQAMMFQHPVVSVTDERA